MLNALKLAALVKLLLMAYENILRPMLKEAIDDPEQEWDDMVLSVCDGIIYALGKYDQ